MFLWFFKKKKGGSIDTHAVHALEQCGKQDLLVQCEHAQECSQWWALQVSDDVLHVVGLCHMLLQSQFPPFHNLFSSTARSSQTSENFPSSMPSPTNQCTKVHLEYSRSNLQSSQIHVSEIVIVLELLMSVLHRWWCCLSPPKLSNGHQTFVQVDPDGHAHCCRSCKCCQVC